MGDDSALLDIVSSANIACGLHAGDWAVMQKTVESALARNVAIGAHPGFPDLQGFGRRRMQGFGGDELQALILYQIGALHAIATAAGGNLGHVKLHGALANMASESETICEAYMLAVKSFDCGLKIMAMAATEIEKAAARHNLSAITEIFADRAYNDDGTLLDRRVSGAIIHDPERAAARVLAMLSAEAVIAESGKHIPSKPQSICVHGDNPAAVAMARHLRQRLEADNIRIQAPK